MLLFYSVVIQHTYNKNYRKIVVFIQNLVEKTLFWRTAFKSVQTVSYRARWFASIGS